MNPRNRKRCPHRGCSHPNLSHARFCAECGRPLANPARRRGVIGASILLVSLGLFWALAPLVIVDRDVDVDVVVHARSSEPSAFEPLPEPPMPEEDLVAEELPPVVEMEPGPLPVAIAPGGCLPDEPCVMEWKLEDSNSEELPMPRVDANASPAFRIAAEAALSPRGLKPADLRRITRLAESDALNAIRGAIPPEMLARIESLSRSRD